MTDQKLTELASLAYGNTPPDFSPLTDDGDALRLAVRLGIQIDPRAPETRVFGPVGERVDEYHKPDSYAATRRAIVRAAAELGRNMP